MKINYQIKKSFAVLLALVLIISVVLFNFPLTDALGFEYSAIFGIILSLFAGIYSASFCRSENAGADVLFRRNKIQFAVMFLLPLLLAVLKSILFPKCPYFEGIIFYFVITLPAMLLGISLGYFSLRISSRFAYVIFVILWLIVLLMPVKEIYSNPQVYFYNSFIGYFPGTIYDEDIPIDHKLIAYRVLIVAMSFFIFLLSDFRFGKIKFSGAFRSLILAFTVFIFGLLKPLLGLATDLGTMKSKLGAELETEHFIINYPKDFDKDKAELIALSHEYYYDNLENSFGVRASAKIRSFIFKNGEQKGRLFGANRADVAKPWLRQIYINYENMSASLQHELAHVISGEFGVTPFKVAHNLNPALIEGVAVAMDNDFAGYDIHSITKMALLAGYRVDVRNLFSGLNFFGQFSSVSYQFAGSFIKFLIDKYGFMKVESLYRDGDFEKSFGKDINALAKEYSAFLDSVKVNFNPNTAQLYFAGMPIFKKFCPRLAAGELKKAARLFSGKNYGEALEKFGWIYNYSQSYSALTGKINSLIRLGRAEQAESFLAKELRKFSKSQYFYNLELILGDLYFRNGKAEQADSSYKALIEQNPSIGYSAAARMRLVFMSEDGNLLTDYLNASPAGRFRILLRKNFEKIIPESVPALVVLPDSSSTDKSEIIGYFRNNLKVSDVYSADAAYNMSLYSLEHSDFESAKYFAVESLKYDSESGIKNKYVKNLKMINWIVNFSGDVRNKVVFK